MTIYDDSSLAPAGYTTICAQPNYTVFNVQSYGATGNGVTDDTVSIRNAIAAAVSNGSGIIWFPAGTYAVCMQAGDAGTYGINASYPVIFQIYSSNLVFQGDNPAMGGSNIVGYMPGLANPVTNWTITGDSYERISRFGMFICDSTIAGQEISGIQWRSLTINGQAGYTGDFSVGGSEAAGSATVANGGSSYSLNDVLTLSGPTPVGTNVATFKVTGVNSGAVTSVSVLTPGAYPFISTSPQSVTGGTGNSCTLNITVVLTGDGWDLSSKCLHFEGSNTLDNILCFNTTIANWRGEEFYGGSSQIDRTYLINCHIYGTNASAVSLPSNMFIVNTTIGGSSTGNDVANCTEVFDQASSTSFPQQLTIQNSVMMSNSATNPANFHAGSGVVYIGTSAGSLTITGTTLQNNHNAILFSEGATNVTIQNCTFTNNGNAMIDSFLGLYSQFPVPAFNDITIENNTFDNSGTVFIDQDSDGIANLVIQGNTILNGSMILGGNFGGTLSSWSGFTIQGNIIGNGGSDVSGVLNGNIGIATWSETIRLPGSSYGNKVDDFDVEATTQIQPISDITLLNANTSGGSQNVAIASSLLAQYPTGFVTKLIYTSSIFTGAYTNWVANADSTWNTWGSTQAIGANGITIKFNGSKFDLVSGTATQLYVAQAPASANVNATFSPSLIVMVLDVNDEGVPSDSSTITLTLDHGSFAGGSTTSVAATAGVSVFSNLAIGTAGTYTITASDGSLTHATTSITIGQVASALWPSNLAIIPTAGSHNGIISTRQIRLVG